MTPQSVSLRRSGIHSALLLFIAVLSLTAFEPATAQLKGSTVPDARTSHVPPLALQAPGSPPGLPGGPAQTPIDGGLGVLAAAGGAYAVRRLRSKKVD